MLTALNKFTAALVLVLTTLYSPYVWSKDCVTCAPTLFPKDAEVPRNKYGRYLGMSGFQCSERNLNASFEEIFCGAFPRVESKADFNLWFSTCKSRLGDKSVNNIIDTMATMKCESSLLKAKRYNEINPKEFIKDFTLPAPTYLLYENANVMKVIEFIKGLMKEYAIEGRGRGYPELKEYIGILNTPDGNDMTFLDHVLLRWDERFVEKVGIKGQRDQLIRALCRTGAKFSSAEDTKTHKCSAHPQYVD